MIKERLLPWAVPALLVALAFAVYSNTSQVPFLLDDYVFIVESEPIRNLSLAFWQLGWSGPNWVDLRPVADLSFRLNYQMSGLNVWSYHAVNICIHALNAVFFYLVVQQVLATRMTRIWAEAAALAAAAVWVVHPINVNAVTYISQRFESLAGLFALAALLAFLRSRLQGSAAGQWWCILFVMASFGSKLSNLALPVLIGLLDRFVLPRSTEDRLRRRLFYSSLAGTWVFAAALFLARGDLTRDSSEGAVAFSIESLKMQSVVIFYYIGKLLWPAGLVFDEGKWLPVPALYWILATIALTAVLVWSIAAVFRRSLPAFGVVAFFLLLGASSSFIVVPVYDAATYRMYLPGASLIALVFGAVGWVLSKQEGVRARIIYLMATFMLAAVLGFTTWQRNRIFNSPADLWADNTAKRPGHSGSYIGLGEALMKEGRLIEAEQTLFLARTKFPKNARLLNLSGMIAMGQGNEVAAVEWWRQASALAPNNHVILNNLAIAAFRNGETDEAEELFARVVELRPRDVIALGNLAQVYISNGKLDEAQRIVRDGIEVLPQDILMQNLQKRIDEMLLRSDGDQVP